MFFGLFWYRETVWGEQKNKALNVVQGLVAFRRIYVLFDLKVETEVKLQGRVFRVFGGLSGYPALSDLHKTVVIP